jgi:hypothetical protein
MADDRAQARYEACQLLGLDIDNLSPADALRVDMVSSLRLVVDAEQASILSGNSADVARLNVAVASLIALLPGQKLAEPAPPVGGPSDRRTIMFETYMAMRRRGEAADPTSTFEGRMVEIERLRARVAELEAGASLAPDEGNNIVSKRSSSSATPADNVVPMSRTPSAPSKPAPPAPATGGLLTDNVDEPWRPFVGGGAHYDRWGNHN